MKYEYVSVLRCLDDPLRAHVSLRVTVVKHSLAMGTAAVAWGHVGVAKGGQMGVSAALNGIIATTAVVEHVHFTAHGIATIHSVVTPATAMAEVIATTPAAVVVLGKVVLVSQVLAYSSPETSQTPTTRRHEHGKDAKDTMEEDLGG